MVCCQSRFCWILRRIRSEAPGFILLSGQISAAFATTHIGKSEHIVVPAIDSRPTEVVSGNAPVHLASNQLNKTKSISYLILIQFFNMLILLDFRVVHGFMLGLGPRC